MFHYKWVFFCKPYSFMTDTIIKNMCHTLIQHSVRVTAALARLSFSFNYNFNLNYAHLYSLEQICIMNEHLNELNFHTNNSHMAILLFSKSTRVNQSSVSLCHICLSSWKYEPSPQLFHATGHTTSHHKFYLPHLLLLHDMLH